MRSTELAVVGVDGPVLVRAPERGVGVAGGVVALHGAALPERDQPLFEHLARTVTPLGYLVSSYDRRAAADGGDTPLAVQADDALAAMAALRAELDAPVGVFGFSQGAWAAALAAARSPEVGFLALVGCCGVSPAVQMRYFTDEVLRRAGYGAADRAQLRAARLAWEAVLRGNGDRERAADLLAAASTRPWFPQAYLPAELPGSGPGWPDMDYDPEPTFAAVACPTLLMYGTDEECVPAQASKDAWRRAARAAGTPGPVIVDLPGCGHFPAAPPAPADRQFTMSDISPAYTTVIRDWFGDLARRPPGPAGITG